MENKLNSILNIIIGSVIGIFLGYGIYTLWDYKPHPGLYAMQSAPWYTGILFYGIFAAVVILLSFLLKRILRKSLQK